MKLSFDFDLDDWTSFQRYHYRHSPQYRRMRSATRMLLPAMSLLVVTSHTLKHGFDPARIVLFVTVSILWFVFYPFWFDRRVIRNSQRFIHEGNTSSLFGRREIELSPDRLYVKSPQGEAAYLASSISKVVESDDALLLYVSPIQAVILPKSKVSEVEFYEAKNFIKEHYSQTQ